MAVDPRRRAAERTWADADTRLPPHSGGLEPEFTGDVASRRPPWYSLRWLQLVVVGIVALLIGVGLGAAGGATAPPVTDSAEFKAQASDLEDAQAEAESTQSELDAANDELASVEGDLPAREQAVTDQTAALEQREAAVAKKEKSVGERERAVGATEKKIAAGTVGGDGSYLVGDDMQPGNYRSEDNSADCYWQTSNDANGSDIIANDIGRRGTRFATVNDGEYFQSQGCSDWVLQ